MLLDPLGQRACLEAAAAIIRAPLLALAERVVEKGIPFALLARMQFARAKALAEAAILDAARSRIELAVAAVDLATEASLEADA